MARAPVDFIDSPKKAKRCVDEWHKEGRNPTALDTEFEPDGTITLMSLSWHSRTSCKVIEGNLVKDYFGDKIVDHKNTRLIMHNYGADANIMYGLGLNPDKSFHADTMTAGWCVNEDLFSHGLKEQGDHFLDWHRKGYKQLFQYVPPGKKKPIVMTPYQVMYKAPDDALLVHTQAEWAEIMKRYSGDDALETKALYVHHRKELEAIDYWKTYQYDDVPFTLTLLRCEERGVLIDLPRIGAIRRKVLARIMRSVHAFRALAGKPDLNLNSGPQMQKLIFDELDWPTREDFMTPKGNPQLNREALVWYAEEHGFDLAKLKLNYNREKTKEGTFLKGIQLGVSDDRRLRSHLNQIGARTGRISSRKFQKEITETLTLKSGLTRERKRIVKVGANLQNIPSRKEKDPDGIRGAFIAPSVGEITARGHVATEDYSLIVADYSGFELCMMIMWTYRIKTKNKRMLKIMKDHNSPSACHAFTAIQMYKPRVIVVPSEQKIVDKIQKITKLKDFYPGKKVRLGDLPMELWQLAKILFPDEYTLSKNNNFNLLYGGSAAMMARLRGLDHRDEEVLRQCEEEIEKWNDTYPEVREYQDYMVTHGYEHGWVPTLNGWRSHVKDMLESSDKGERAHGERTCMNTPCQGSAGQIVKRAMNYIENNPRINAMLTGKVVVKSKSRRPRHDWRTIKPEHYEEALKNFKKSEPKAKIKMVPAASLLFPVHDEIVMEAPTRVAKPVEHEMLLDMKRPFADEMPFEHQVEAGIAKNWQQAKV